MFRLSRLALPLALLVPAAALPAAPWPAVDSDLPADPALRTGTLPNCLRFALLPNAEPQGRVSLRLLVAAGSLVEADDERGLAHFIEHMAFRGTKQHPAGSMTAALQRLGIGFGPDSAAFTTYDHTIYHLELPDPREATLREGLNVFREYAESVTFAPDLIERERGVVLNEQAMRSTPELLVSEVNQAYLWPDARRVQRAVIGTSESLRTMTREKFTAFYDAWYRPERLAVIAVGDVDPALVEKLLGEILGPLAARAPARAEPADLSPATASDNDVRVFTDPRLIGLSFMLEHPTPVPHAPDTRERRVAELHRWLAFQMFQQRLARVARKLGSSFVAPASGQDEPMPDWRLTYLAVSGKLDNWQLLARDLEQEHRRTFLHGFTVQELQEARASAANSYEEAVRSAATRPSPWLASSLAGCLLQGRVFPTPEARRDDLAAALAATNVDDCTKAFRAAWTTKAPHIFAAANPAFQISREALAAVLNESRKIEVGPPEEAAPVRFAYADFGPPGKLVREDRLADLDARLCEFANGVRFNFKSTAFNADYVDVCVRVGTGKLGQPEDRPGLDLLAAAAFTGGGLRRHTLEDGSSLFSVE